MNKITPLIMVLLISAKLVYGQSKIQGIVKDENGEPLPGATIISKGKPGGVISDIEGNFSIAAERNDVLVVSFVGYKQQEKTVANLSFIEVQLLLDSEVMEELIVVGYGVQKKSDVASAISSVNTDDLNPGPTVSVSNFLQNTAPGVVLTQNSAQPGGGFNVQVRGQTSLLGSNEPLYVIDGMPIVNDQIASGTGSSNSPAKNPLNGINPQDIVSIEILKDAASAAIYGARASNGVILITTRRGKGAAKVDYSSSISFQEVAKQYDLLNAKEFAQVSNEWAIQNGNTEPFSQGKIDGFGEGTNWNDLLLRTGIIQQHQLAISGGDDAMSYYVSGNYFDHQGIVENSGLTRYAGRINLTSKITSKLEVGTILSMSQTVDNQVHFGSTGGGGGLATGLFDNTILWAPTVDVFDADGEYTRHPERPNQIPHPLSLLEEENQSISKRFIGSFYFNYELIPNLFARVNFGIDDQSVNQRLYIPTTVLRGANQNGIGEMLNDRANNILSEFTLNYSKTINSNHNLNTLLGYTYQSSQQEGFSVLSNDFASQTININNLNNAAQSFGSSYKSPLNKVVSYVARANYDFKNKYLLTVTMRADGSTKFGPSNKWGYFPSAAMAWKLHNENFFNSTFIDQMKVRLSYGQTGNQELIPKVSQALYAPTRNLILGTNPSRLVGLHSIRPENENLKWETTSQFNLGMDFSFLGGRIQTSFDAYQKTTTDVLLQLELATTSGYEFVYTNAGAIQNRGLELQIQSSNLTGQLSWNTSFNIAYNKNRWKDRGGKPFKSYEDEFGPVGAMFALEVEGVFQDQAEIDADGAQPTAAPGHFNFRDVNGDAVIDANDRVFMGQSQPDLTWGVNNKFVFKAFDLNFFFQGAHGNKKHNGVRAALNDVSDIGTGANQSVQVLNRWTPENPSQTIPSGGQGWQETFNSVYLEDASFVRLRNITLGYTTSVSKVFSSLRVYVDAQNLLLFTKWSGLDPETGGSIGNQTNPELGQEATFPQYPAAKTYTVGLNVTF